MIQSNQAAELAPVATVLTAGVETVNIYDIDLSGGVDVSEEMIEAALLPANAILTGITAIGAGTGAVTADIGIMDGDWRDNDDTRSITTVLMNDVDLDDATAEGAVDTLTDVAMSGAHRSIGIAFSGDIAAGAGKSVKLIVRTIMG
jgi:hypothetical protein